MFALGTPRNAEALRWRWNRHPTMLHRLCDLPFGYFCEPRLRAVLLVLPTQVKNLRAALATIARNGSLGLHRPFMAALASIACMAALAVIAFIANMAVLAFIASSGISWPSLLS